MLGLVAVFWRIILVELEFEKAVFGLAAMPTTCPACELARIGCKLAVAVTVLPFQAVVVSFVSAVAGKLPPQGC
jgi:hypothetical protein